MNKRDKEIVRAYERSEKFDLFDAYKSVSGEKVKAFKYCRELCKRYKGEGLKIIGANTFKFSAGFMFMEDGKDYLMYITDCGDRKIEIKEEE